MPFPRPRVQFVGDVIAVRLGRAAQALAFRQVLADQPVEVLVAALFPGMVGRGEVARNGKALFQRRVGVELGTIRGVDADLGYRCKVAQDLRVLGNDL